MRSYGRGLFLLSHALRVHTFLMSISPILRLLLLFQRRAGESTEENELARPLSAHFGLLGGGAAFGSDLAPERKPLAQTST